VGTDALIYVVDSNDRDRLEEAADELWSVLNNEEIKNVPVLVLANKQDMPYAMTVSQIAEKFKMTTLKNKWFIAKTCAKSGEGLLEGLDWLSDILNKRK
jgi:signal recognition particle receptor subunit beta